MVIGTGPAPPNANVGHGGGKQGVKWTEPEASLWKILPIVRHVESYKKIQGSLKPIQNGTSPPFRDVAMCTSVHLHHHTPYISFVLRMPSYKIEFTRIPEFVRRKHGVLLQTMLASALDAAPSLIRPLWVSHARKRRNYVSIHSLENYITKLLS